MRQNNSTSCQQQNNKFQDMCRKDFMSDYYANRACHNESTTAIDPSPLFINRTTSVEEYWENYVLGHVGSSWENYVSLTVLQKNYHGQIIRNAGVIYFH